MPSLQRLHQRPADGPARVVDQDVDLTNSLYERVDGVHVRQVRGHRDRVAASRRDPLDELGQQVLAARHRDHRRAFGGELLRCGRADPR